MTETIALDLDEQTGQRLRSLAADRGDSAQALVRLALVEFLDREAARHEAREDEARWERYRSSGKSVPHSEVAGWLEGFGEGAERPCPR